MSLVPAGKRFRGRLLEPLALGRFTLPVWPDHVGSKTTRWGRYRLGEVTELDTPGDEMFTTMAP